MKESFESKLSKISIGLSKEEWKRIKFEKEKKAKSRKRIARIKAKFKSIEIDYNIKIMYPIEQIEKHANNSRVIVWHIIGGIEQTGFVSDGRILLDRHRDFGEWTSLDNYSHFIKLSELNRILTDKFYN